MGGFCAAQKCYLCFLENCFHQIVCDHLIREEFVLRSFSKHCAGTSPKQLAFWINNLTNPLPFNIQCLQDCRKTWKQAEGVPSVPSYLKRHWLQDLANTSPNDLRVARVDGGIKAWREKRIKFLSCCRRRENWRNFFVLDWEKIFVWESVCEGIAETMRCTNQPGDRQVCAKRCLTSSQWKRELRSRSNTVQVNSEKCKCGNYIHQHDEFHLWVIFKLLNLLSRRNHVDIQTAVRSKVYVIWRNRKYEKFSKSCELFENHNFRRTPRNNSSQNSLSGNLVKLNQN